MQTSERILFVDDDAMVRSAFARSLRRQGFEVDLAGGEAEATKLAAENTYAVIAADYRMPDIDGLNLVGHLRGIQPDATYMLVSGECDLDLALQAVNEFSVSYVIAKPWDIEELSSMLRRSIEHHYEKVGQRKLQSINMKSTSEIEAQRRSLQSTASTAEASMAEVLLNTLNLRDNETRGHCKRVAAYAKVIAEALGIRGQALVAIEQGSLLHDIGKVGIPDAILKKPDRLTDEDWLVLKRHTVIGGQLLDGIESMKQARAIVVQHHERWDGGGYPNGLAGEEIVLGARIFAVVDALDAILSDRPYRPARDIDTAIAEIQSCSGSQFDPNVVNAFLSIPKARWLEIRVLHPDEPKLVAGTT